MAKDAEKQDSSRKGIQVIARAAAIMRALENEPKGLSLGEIAQRVDLARSTVQRIVGALAEEHFLIAATAKARVKLGPALIRLATAANLEIDEIVRPIMQRLSRNTGETVDLSVLKGGSAVFIDQIPGSYRLQAVSAVGESFPLTCTANGKALMAFMSPQERQRIFDEGLKRYTVNTIIGVETLAAQISDFNKQFYALDEEEHTEGICAVGTAFTDPMDRPFAISIPVPTPRFERKKQELIKELLKAREEIQKELHAE
ncbi:MULTISPECIES: IclR family transcriptional regulator [Kordiimonas]|jgi:DNA-binding IclR family transcriptional regulator|uniref:IclR family transcriptional regulator n=1 Tax=Kordiimonas TaxID=288021 RepID=UPI00257C9ED9|nr:IclR family transcriptional regulator [Kordiimonas sp. UBA4487]